MLFKNLLLILLLFTGFAQAQERKTPRLQPEICLKCEEMTENDSRAVRGIVSKNDVIRNKITSYKEVVMELQEDKKYDTTELYFYKYYVNGAIKSRDAYKYGDEDMDNTEELLFNKLHSGTRTSYTYDSYGNLVSEKGELISAANSVDAFYSYLHQIQQQQSPDDAGFKNMMENYRKWEDSMAKALSLSGIPEIVNPTSMEKKFRYNKDQNLINIYTKDDTTDYYYKHYPDGYVKSQKMIRTANNGRFYYNRKEYFKYTSQHKLERYTKYEVSSNTTSVESEQYKVLEYIYTYDSNGHPASMKEIRYRDGKMALELTHIYTYTGQYETSDISLIAPANDTLELRMKKYENGKLTEETDYFFVIIYYTHVNKGWI